MPKYIQNEVRQTKKSIFEPRKRGAPIKWSPSVVTQETIKLYEDIAVRIHRKKASRTKAWHQLASKRSAK